MRASARTWDCTNGYVMGGGGVGGWKKKKEKKYFVKFLVFSRPHRRCQINNIPLSRSAMTDDVDDK